MADLKNYLNSMLFAFFPNERRKW